MAGYANRCFPVRLFSDQTWGGGLAKLGINHHLRIARLFGVSVALRSDRDQFAFMIPYVQFRREGAEGDPLLLDTNIIIDGRILKVAQTGFLSGPLVVPRFVLDELQRLTESGDSQKPSR